MENIHSIFAYDFNCNFRNIFFSSTLLEGCNCYVHFQMVISFESFRVQITESPSQQPWSSIYLSICAIVWFALMFISDLITWAWTSENISFGIFTMVRKDFSQKITKHRAEWFVITMCMCTDASFEMNKWRELLLFLLLSICMFGLNGIYIYSQNRVAWSKFVWCWKISNDL